MVEETESDLKDQFESRESNGMGSDKISLTKKLQELETLKGRYEDDMRRCEDDIAAVRRVLAL